jgi:hypothetical protein
MAEEEFDMSPEEALGSILLQLEQIRGLIEDLGTRINKVEDESKNRMTKSQLVLAGLAGMHHTSPPPPKQHP